MSRALKGFTMVELMVVTAIISIMSTTAVAGFNVLGEVLSNKSASGVIEDIIENTQLKLLRGEFSEIILHFSKDYLVAEEIAYGATAGLKLEIVDSSVCPEGYQIQTDTSSSLVIKGYNQENESIMFGLPNPSDPNFCPPFKDAKDTEWIYERRGGYRYSNTIKFMHFNLDRDRLTNLIELTGDGVGKTLIMEGTYAKKIGTISLILKPENGSSTLPLVINP